jgi:glutaminase
MITNLLKETHAVIALEKDGENASYIPALASVNPDLYGIAAVSVDGEVWAVGDVDVPFTIQSISKPFSYAVALDLYDHDKVFSRVGVEPSGEPFNSARLDSEGKPPNPMVNAGAIGIVGMLVDAFGEAAYDTIHAKLAEFAGGDLGFNARVYVSESNADHINRSIAYLLVGTGVVESEPDSVCDAYTRVCSQEVTTRQLAMMAATLANGGINPTTGNRVVSQAATQITLAVLSTCGLYDGSGEAAVHLGIPAKSGVSGGVMGVVNRELGIATYSPRLDGHGNSVRGFHTLQRVSKELGLHTYASIKPSDSGFRPTEHRHR